jgi:hypothetical protein
VSEYIIGAVLIVLGLAFFAAVAVAKAKIGWSFVNYDKEDKD